MPSNLEISQHAKLKPIEEIAKKIGLKKSDLEFYGKFIAKIPIKSTEKNSKLILVTAMTPTKFGEGKTTTSIAVGQGIHKLGKKVITCLREPSLGPCFGIKGGGCGSGKSQVLPMEEINLAFTGDIPAITAANNLLASMIDNHLAHENKLGLNPKTILWRRCLDTNDRALREIIIGKGKKNGLPRKDRFRISAASEVMAIFCLSKNLEDLKNRLGKILLGHGFDGKKIYASDLKAQGAMTVLLKHAFKPNLVQSVEGMPVIIHGGPFANIAHGCNSIVATKTALSLADYVVTEAGFGSDLGAEKFFDIKCREFGLKPSAVVLVVTVKAINYHGDGNLEEGFENVKKHVEIISSFGFPVVIAINKFNSDEKKDLEKILQLCKENNFEVEVSEGSDKGGVGTKALAKKVLKVAKKKIKPKFVYPLNLTIKEKIELICKKVYGAKKITYSKIAEKAIASLEKDDYGTLPVCMAKTPASLSGDAKKKNVPKKINIRIRNVYVSAGAGFVVALVGEIMTMPGLPAKPNAENITVDKKGRIIGLF